MSTAPRSVSTGQAVWLVAEREIMSKLRSKAFVISTVILMAIALAGVLILGFTGQNGGSSSTAVAVTADAASQVQDKDGFEVTEVADRADAEQLVKDGDVAAALVADESSPTGYTVLFKNDPSGSQSGMFLVMDFATMPKVDVLEPSSTDNALRFIVAIALGMVFLFAAQMFGATIAQSVVEEKQTRVVEILISSISTRALLAGKVIGNTVLAMGQIIVLGAIVIVGLTVTGQNTLLAGVGIVVVWFAIFFLFGFVLLAALYAAAAAMVSRQEDIGTTTTPLMLLIMAPYFLVIFFNDNSTVLTIMSYVPFSAPVGMPMRLFLGEAQWWEPLLSLAILIVTCLGAIVVGARIYDRTLLKMGSRVKLLEALRG